MTQISRRDLLRSGAAAGALTALSPSSIVRDALAATPCGSRLHDIEHFVILMQENRSFDHYFGRYKGVRGFDDKKNRAAFAQSGYPVQGFNGKLLPFHLNSSNRNNQCFPDITHDWGPQHRAWNSGKNNGFVKVHVKEEGAQDGATTMGYYERSDLPFYWALADKFTLCDGFHCSVIGPTDPNRLMSMSASLDPAGKHGGPHLSTLVSNRSSKAGKYTWTTYPERLEAKKVSWKIYTSPAGGSFDNVMPYFKNFQTKANLKAKGITPTYPNDFLEDIRLNKLPAVSWVLTGIGDTEHPGLSEARSGEKAAADVLSALTKNKKLWSKTALIITWDENGGFFDHVPPRTPPKGTKDEFVTVAKLPAEAQGIRGPIGLGFRIPTLIVSPFSRGGFVCSDTFDHTSVLRLLETRFGAEVPNLSKWRRSVTGNLTSAFNFARKDTSIPSLPKPPGSTGSCFNPKDHPVVPHNKMPKQVPGKARRPSGPC